MSRVSERPDSPYRGLSQFGDTALDALFFFGRAREREIIVANLIASRLTVLYGPSGVGKSSILNASVARELRGLPEEPLVVVFARWNEDPTAVFDEAIAAAESGERDVYLLLDQLEEYFLYRESRNGLGGELARLLDPSLRVNLLLSVREDELAKLDRFKSSVPALFANVLRLDRLDRAAARAAIVEPLARWNDLTGEHVSIEPELVDAVLDEVGESRMEEAFAARGISPRGDGGGIEAPFLQLVMQRLWEVERESGSPVLRGDTFRELGGAPRIVADHLESALAGFTAREEDVAAKLFHHLVTPSGTKIAHDVGDLAGYVAVGEDVLRPVLATLAAHRILRPLEHTPGHDERFEIFHDVLADPVLAWRSQHELVRERAAARKRHRRLGVLAVGALAALAVVAAIAVFALAQRTEARERARSAQARELGATALTQLDVDPALALLLATRAADLEHTPQVDDVLRTALERSRLRAVARVPAVQGLVLERGRNYAVARGRVARMEGLEPRAPRPLRGRFLGVHRGTALSVAGKTLTLHDLESGKVQRVRVPSDEDVPVRNVEFGHVVGEIHVPPIRLAAVGRDRTLLAVSGGGRDFALVNLLTGEGRYRREQEARVTALAFAPRARLLAVGGADGVVRLWSVGGGTLYGALRAPRVGRITDIAFSPRSTLLAAASADGSTRVWRVGSADPVAVLTGHTSRVDDVAFSADGSAIVTASADGTARVWKADTGGNLAVLRGHGDAVTTAAFTRDGAQVLTAGVDGTLRRWDSRAQRELELLARLPGPIVDASFAGAEIQARTANGTTHIVDARDGRKLGVRELPAERSEALTIRGRVVTLRKTGGATVTLRGHIAEVTTAELSPDGSRVVSASRDGEIRVWDGRTGARLRTLRGHGGAVNDVSFSPDGQWIVSAGPRTAALWETEDGRFLFFLSGHKAAVRSARFDATGTRIVTGSDDRTVRVFDCELCASGRALLATARERLRLTGRKLTPAERARFLPDG